MAEEYIAYDGPIVTRATARTSGLPRFFTGRPCLKGHVAQRFATNSDCVLCRLERRAKSYAEHRDENKAAASVWYRANLERGRATRKIYGGLNSDATKARCALWYRENKERAYAHAKEWKAANPVRVAAAAKRWAANNLEKRRAYVRNRRARLRNAEGSHTGAEIVALLTRQRQKCAACGASLRGGYHADHIVAISRGGTNWIKNIQLLCPPCNLAKWNKHPIDWARENGRLL